jgi:isoamylase-like protein
LEPDEPVASQDDRDRRQGTTETYNGWWQPITITLPNPLPGRAWFRVGDTADWMEVQGNFKDPGQEDPLVSKDYKMEGRSVLVLIER